MHEVEKMGVMASPGKKRGRATRTIEIRRHHVKRAAIIEIVERIWTTLRGETQRNERQPAFVWNCKGRPNSKGTSRLPVGGEVKNESKHEIYEKTREWNKIRQGGKS
jgi:hypothetical protein